jgi:Tol biopolymer transport system component/DNA-binding winged helix-turn-helix (wHTH) protein
MDDRVDEERLMAGFWVGDWFVEPLRNRITAGVEAVLLEPKIMDVLVCLARRPGRTITKDRFMDEVWSGMVVTDDVLARCISELRKVLGDNSRNPTFIETIRKTGYRLIAPVELAGPGVALAPAGGPRRPDGGVGGAAQHPVALSTLWVLFRQSLGAWVRERRAYLLALGGFALLAAGVGGGVLMHSAAEEATAPLPVTMPFTTFPGLEVDPQLSPDGQQVAYASDDESGRDFDIYIKQYGAEIPLRITDERTDERRPAWSPDGLHLAFVRSAAEQHAVYVVPSIGGNERMVVDFGARRVQGLSWSPDGRTLAAAVQHARYGGFRLFLVDVDSAAVQPLTVPPATALGDIDPVFSPDGERLSFTRSLNEEVQDVFLVTIADGQVEQLTFDSTRVAGHSWTRDGKGIILASQRGGPSGLWRVAVSGGTPEQIAAAGEGQVLEHPSVAREADRLTYAQRSSDANIWKLVRTARDPIYKAHPLLASTKWDSNPAISPAGDRIAFATRQSGFHEIWLTDHEGANPVQLTAFGGPYTGTPSWSPDGASIAFVSRQEGRANVYVASAEGGAPLRLTEASAEDAAPSWSRDSVSVYYASDKSGSWEIWKVPRTGGDPVRVTYGGGRAAREGPEGKALYYVRPDTAGIWRLPLAPAAPAAPAMPAGRIIDAFDPADWGNWSVVDDGIYFVRRVEGTPVLFFYDFGTAEERRVDTLDAVPGHPALAIVADGMWLLYTQVEDGESDIFLVEHFR